MRFTSIFLLVLFLAACSGASPTAPTHTAPIAISPSPVQVMVPAPQTSLPPTDTPPPAATATSVVPPHTPTPEPSLTPAGGQVSSLPDPALYTWRVVVEGLVKPVGLVHAGDQSGRLFVIEQAGLIRLLRDGNLSPEPFLDIRDRVGSQGFEQGLLGLAFHPRYAENGFFYVNYTDSQGDTVIARFRVSDQDADRADPGSETRLLVVPQPYPNHNGGMVAFGPDGYLYLGLGDGGSAGDPYGNGQLLITLLGKILRIDVDRGDPYAIPPDNPYVNGGGLPEIWAYGLRNPWRFAFDRLTGDLYIGDVGQSQWEEINYLPAGSLGGANFGWNYLEGAHPYAGVLPADLELVAPIAEYNHQSGCSVTGGVVYRGALLADWRGVYLYGDYCSGRIWGLVRNAEGSWVQAVLFEGMGSISSFGEDESGEVYLVNHAGSISILTGG